MNVAVTEVSAWGVTTQVPVPEQAPLQPVKVEPVTGVAVRVRGVAGATDCEHVQPQLMPAGALATTPAPVPFLTTERTGKRSNVAVTEVAVLTVTTQVPVPEQGPLQPVKVEPVTGVAVRVRTVPGATDCEHVHPQLMPALATTPAPVPFLTTERTGKSSNLALTDVGAVTVTEQVPVPEQAPPQPAKKEPAAGVAVRVRTEPGVTDCEHVAPQLMPAGVLVTVPVPVPFLATESVTGPVRLNIAVTDVAALTVTTHVPVPEQAPLQPAKKEPAAGVAVSVRAVPGATVCEHVAPQLMPVGALVTVPVPEPVLLTDSVTETGADAGRAGTARPPHDISELTRLAALTASMQTNPELGVPLG